MLIFQFVDSNQNESFHSHVEHLNWYQKSWIGFRFQQHQIVLLWKPHSRKFSIMCFVMTLITSYLYIMTVMYEVIHVRTHQVSCFHYFFLWPWKWHQSRRYRAFLPSSIMMHFLLFQLREWIPVAQTSHSFSFVSSLWI